MAIPVLTRVKNAWNAFRSIEEQASDLSSYNPFPGIGSSSFGYRQDKPRFGFISERSVISSVYTRIAVDVSSYNFRHVMTDELGRFSNNMDSYLNSCLTLQPNIDQGPRAFYQDIVARLFDKGVIAVVAVDTTSDPRLSNSFDIKTLRVGEILDWYPKHVKISLYNENSGKREEITLAKEFVSIIENPFYSLMNEPNSTLTRLIKKLSLMDDIDELSVGRLDIIVQLPYAVKSETRKQQAEARRDEIEFQLRGSQYGIAYADATEKIVQLNRPVENQLLKQVEYLVNLLYSQLGITQSVMDGTADEKTMKNYFNRSVKPVLDAIREAMQRSFIGFDRTNKGEKISYFIDPFALVSVTDLAAISDVFARNEIVTSNEIRGFIGMVPSKDPKADQLINSNMPQSSETTAPPT